VLKSEESEWVKVGKLLAIRLDPTHPWQIGVIRRITRMHDDTRKIGVQMLNSEPMLVQLETHESEASIDYSIEPSRLDQQPNSHALIFPNIQDANLIIMESARYAHDRQYKMRDQTGWRQIRLDSVRDKGDGWLMSTYKQSAG